MPDPAPRGRVALSRDLIVETAVGLARAEGIHSVTMRRIAADLGVEAMSIYHHIPSKATLLVMMADWSLSQVAPPDPGQPWQDQLTELLMNTYRAGAKNPTLFEVLASASVAEHHIPAADADTGAATTTFHRQIQALLNQSGLPLHQQAHAFRGLIGMLIGFIVVRADAFLAPPPQRSGTRRRGANHNTDQPTPTPDPQDALQASIRWLLNGLLPDPSGT
ncbi:AcrR family transcriptional regulator [Nakamurella sp. UYEF19]|uniref:TetR/AcrR family transcriptional regulator n=1 Tax=Nakamurella sp. UYEF19 TaxID=1756392 RepID=UPI0033992170